jgi:prepilin-type N-terminal cleavage/methylation domain-containing protein
MGGSRRGLTLVELLVVVTILVMLLTVAVPLLTPSLESRRMREAARQVNLYLNRARSMAMEKRRPVGVWLERRQGFPQAVTQLFIVEERPRLSWTSENLPTPLITIEDPNPPQQDTKTVTLPPAAAADIQPGDQIQVNFQGPVWEIGKIQGNQWTFRRMGLGPPTPPNIPAPGVPFQIRRDIRVASWREYLIRSAASPLALPIGIAIDTQWSGVGDSDDATFVPATLRDSFPVLIMFSPKGEVESVWYSVKQNGVPTLQRAKVTEPIFLLVGKLNRIPDPSGGPSPAEDGLYNWQDLSNCWVVVTPGGMVKTVEVAGLDPNSSDPPLTQSRRFAQGQSMGGK